MDPFHFFGFMKDSCGCGYVTPEGGEKEIVPAFCNKCDEAWIVNCGTTDCPICKNTTVRLVSQDDLKLYNLTRHNDRCKKCGQKLLYICKDENALYMSACITQLHHMVATKAHRIVGICLPVVY
jgi:hypothetical protein